jgi:AcrR family transcriptional regulator
MTRGKTQRTRPTLRREDTERNTRRRLLEAAGQVFAEMGFDRATGKEICERADTNTAAVNYYFGSVEGLYEAVIREARDRLVTTEAVQAAVAGKADARAQLGAILELLARAVTGPVMSSWAPRVLLREMAAPSAAHEAIEKEFPARARILRGVVAELTGLPDDHPAVARGCLSVIGPCFALVLMDRRTLKQMFPTLTLGPEDAPALARHLTQFALAGLSAVARDQRAV